MWDAAATEERPQLVWMVFEAVYVDTKAKGIVAYQIKEPYRALFTLCEGVRDEAGLLVTEGYAQLAGIGNLNQP